jgi:hypothetical protein
VQAAASALQVAPVPPRVPLVGLGPVQTPLVLLVPHGGTLLGHQGLQTSTTRGVLQILLQLTSTRVALHRLFPFIIGMCFVAP